MCVSDLQARSMLEVKGDVLFPMGVFLILFCAKSGNFFALRMHITCKIFPKEECANTKNTNGATCLVTCVCENRVCVLGAQEGYHD